MSFGTSVNFHLNHDSEVEQTFPNSLGYSPQNLGPVYDLKSRYSHLLTEPVTF